jgi:DNA-binding MarR family transcriptional regulator
VLLELALTPSAKPTDEDLAIEKDLGELASLLGETFRSLKQSSPAPAVLREAAERGSLNARHMPVLHAVTLAGPLSVSELAKRIGLSLSTTSGIVGELSRAGLVDRTEDDNDRRRTIVALHDDYRELLSEWTNDTLAPVRTTLETLSPQARANFMEGWRILHREANGPRRAPGATHD